MSDSIQKYDGETGVGIAHRYDFSGDVRFSQSNADNSPYVDVPFMLLLELVSEYVQEKRIDKLATMTPREILGLSTTPILHKE